MEDLVSPSARFWQGKRVLVTGHTGFKGTWLSLWLRALGAEVVGLSLPATEPSLFRTAGIDGLVKSHYGDIRELRAVSDIFDKERPEIVLHLAAQSLVRASYRDPIETFATNIMGTAHVLAGARAAGSVRAVVVVTTDKCYENRDWLWAYRETDRLGGRDPYSASKACAELVTSAWRSSFQSDDMAIASARAGNVIGGGDWAEDRLIPDCIRAISKGQVIVIRNPGATRPWQHVLDPLCGYLTLAERMVAKPEQFSEAWNFGPVEEDARPVEWIADRIVTGWGDGAAWKHVPQAGAVHEATFLKVDASKARQRLAWRQRLRLEEGLDWTIAWYRAFREGASARALTEDQIARFSTINTFTS